MAQRDGLAATPAIYSYRDGWPEDLAQYSTWQPFLHDLKEVEVKHGVRVHIFNLYTDDAGNAAVPKRVRRRKNRSMMLPAIGIAGLVIVAIIGAVLLFNPRSGSCQSDTA